MNSVPAWMMTSASESSGPIAALCSPVRIARRSAIDQSSLGSGHEDPKLDWSIADLRAIRTGEHSAAIGPLLSLAEVIIQAGTEFIAFLQDRHGYKPTYSWEQHAGPP